MKYKTPIDCYFRIHHIRPRFKNNVEEVLIYVASEIAKLDRDNKGQFMVKVNEAISLYPTNATAKDKTINNWRTEISALFGLIEFDTNSNECWPGLMAKMLARNQDLVEFFKYFLFYFQYPGGHLKPHETLKYIESEIRFKPAKYVLRMLMQAENITKKRFGITKAELTHCVFNDLRVTRDCRPVEEVLELIQENRRQGINYDQTGDVIRYAGDILDYMVIADLLVNHYGKFYLNLNQQESIAAFINSELMFTEYDGLYGKSSISIEDIKSKQDSWFKFVNQKAVKDLFRTNLFNFLGIDEKNYLELPSNVSELITSIHENGNINTKEVGDVGEFLIIGHESMRLKMGGRIDLVKLVQRIPSKFGLGYDISSVELDEKKRLVEVKTTVSRSRISFNNFHLTPSEWKAAQSFDGSYFVYRLMVSKESTRLFIIQDIVNKFKKDQVRMAIRDGADITFDESSGYWEELLIWEK